MSGGFCRICCANWFLRGYGRQHMHGPCAHQHLLQLKTDTARHRHAAHHWQQAAPVGWGQSTTVEAKRVPG